MIYISFQDIMEAEMQVSKWGNSLAVRLPKALVDELGLVAGDELNVLKASKQQIVVEKADRRAEFLKQMEQFQWSAPEGYKFDRDEANER
jgi:antitoxin MazE